MVFIDVLVRDLGNEGNQFRSMKMTCGHNPNRAGRWPIMPTNNDISFLQLPHLISRYRD
jgi:hypothetical protein